MKNLWLRTAVVMTPVLLSGAAMATEEGESPIEQVFAQVDVPTILTQVVTAGVALMGIYIAVRGILFAKKLIGKFF